MPTDPHDELARLRSRRDRDRRTPDPSAADDTGPATGRAAEQREAIARAREAWALSRPDRDEMPAGGAPEGGGPEDDDPSGGRHGVGRGADEPPV